MRDHLHVLPADAAPEASPLGAARVRRRLTVEEVAARSSLSVDDVRALEEGRIYRFRSVNDALAASLVCAAALGISEREARRLAGLSGGGRRWSLRRWGAVAAFAASLAALGWFVAVPEMRDFARPASPTAGEATKVLPPPWEIRVDIFNGTRTPNAATRMANEVGGPLAYRLGTVENAGRLDYVQTRVYYPPGSEEIANRLARELGVPATALPGGKNPNRLIVIVGADRTAPRGG